MKKLILIHLKKAISIILTAILLLSTVSFKVFAANPKVSIIIPVYNTPENLLRDCLESAKNQTLKDIEIICVDDGSTDGSGKILDEYAKADPRFVVIHQKNGGCAVARNKGMDLAKGEYIQFIDSDDTVVDTMSEKCYNKAKEYDADIIKCSNYGKSFGRRGGFEINVPNGLICDVSSNFNQGAMHVIWNGIWKRKFLTDNNFRFDETQFARTDTSFSVVCGLYTNKIVGIAEKLYNYNKYFKPNSICGICDKNGDIDDRCGMYRFIFKHIKAIDDDVVTERFIKWFLSFAVKHSDRLEVQKIISEILQNISINKLPISEKIKLKSMMRITNSKTNPQKTLDDGIYTISSKLDPNMCLDINQSSKDDKANLQLWQKNGTNAQKFKIQYNPDGYYTIKAMCSGKFIDVSGSGKQKGTNVWQYSGNGTDAQKWFVVPDGEGYYCLVSKCNGLCMDDSSMKAKNGANIHCWGIHGRDNQRFKLEKCEDKPSSSKSNTVQKLAGKPRPHKPVRIKRNVDKSNSSKPINSKKSA